MIMITCEVMEDFKIQKILKFFFDLIVRILGFVRIRTHLIFRNVRIDIRRLSWRRRRLWDLGTGGQARLVVCRQLEATGALVACTWSGSGAFFSTSAITLDALKLRLVLGIDDLGEFGGAFGALFGALASTSVQTRVVTPRALGLFRFRSFCLQKEVSIFAQRTHVAFVIVVTLASALALSIASTFALSATRAHLAIDPDWALETVQSVLGLLGAA